MKSQTNGTTGPPGVNDHGSGFPGKRIALQHVFYLTVARIEEKDTKTGKSSQK